MRRLQVRNRLSYLTEDRRSRSHKRTEPKTSSDTYETPASSPTYVAEGHDACAAQALWTLWISMHFFVTVRTAHTGQLCGAWSVFRALTSRLEGTGHMWRTACA